MKCGTTGSSQVLGRSSIPFRDMIRPDRPDCAYIVGRSMFENFRLMLRTFSLIMRKKGGALTIEQTELRSLDVNL